MTEFYEKYWRVNGQPVPPLPPEEKEIWDASESLGVPPYVRFWKRRFGWVYEAHPYIKNYLKTIQK